MTDLALDDFADARIVVYALRPFSVYRGMALLTGFRRPEFRPVRGDLRYRISSIVAKAVKGIFSQKLLSGIGEGACDHHKENESNNMFWHDFAS